MQNGKTYVYFRGLNAIRFFSALAVILYHSLNGFRKEMHHMLDCFVHNLSVGVDFFFLISGFLIVYLLLKEKEKSDSISLFKFYMRRILRIFPVYFLVIAIAYFVFQNAKTSPSYLEYGLFIGNFSMMETGWPVSILVPLWSVCIEEQFYLVVPLLIFIIPQKHLSKLFIAITIFSIVFRAYAFYELSPRWMILYAHSFSRIDVIAIGGLMACWHFKNNFTVKLNGYQVFTVLMFLVVLMSAFDFMDYDTFFRAVFFKYCYVLPLLLIFLSMTLNRNENILVFNVFERSKPINFLGKISYGLYMYHQVVMLMCTKVSWIENSVYFNPIVVTLGSVAMASLSYFIIEKPILKLKDRFQSVRSGFDKVRAEQLVVN